MPYDSWANRIAILRFVQDIPLHRDHPSWQDLVDIEQGLVQLDRKPMLVCWGGRDFCFTKHFFTEWQRRFPGADCRYFAEAGHYLLEDAFEDIYPLVQQFVAEEGKGIS
jgi:haloalkane dehalogenase